MASVKRKPLLIGVIAVATIAVAVLATDWVESTYFKPSPATDYLNKIDLAGYQRIATATGQKSGGTTSTGVYFGSAVPEQALLRLISGPDLQLKSTDLAAYGIAPQPNDQFDQVALEYSAPYTCGVQVGMLRQTGTVDPGWGLSKQQAQQIQSGTSMVFELQVSCGVTIGVGVGIS